MATNRLQFDITAKDRTKRAFSAIKKGLGGLRKAVLNFKTAIVAAVGVAGIGLLIRNSMKSLDAIGKMSRQLFISTEDLGAFRLAADLGGTSLEAFAKGVRTMGVGINDWLVKGTGIAKEAFEQLGITQEQVRATNGDLFAQFQLVADGLNELEGNVDKTAIAYKLFGGRNIELLTAIEGGAAGIQNIREEAEKFGLVLSSEMIKKVEDANDAIARVKLRITGLSDNITVVLAPAFELLANKIGGAFDKFIENQGGLDKFAETMGVTLVTGVQYLIRAFGKFAVIMQKVFTKVVDFVKWTGLLEDAESALVSQMRELQAQQDKLILQYERSWINQEQFRKGMNALNDELLVLKAQYDSTQEPFSEFNMEGFSLIEWLKKADEGLTVLIDDMKITKTETEENTEALVDYLNAQKEIAKYIGGDHSSVLQKRLEDESSHLDKLDKIYANYHRLRQIERMKEKEAKEKLMTEWNEHMMSSTERALASVSGLNKKAFDAYKRFAIGKAIMDTYQAAMAAYAKFGGWPWGALAASATIAEGMAKVAVIRQQTYSGKLMGGNVKGGTPYMVGEQGKEMFVPNQDGSIVPNNELGRNVYITFKIDTVDAGGFDQLLTSRRAVIVNMINSAVNEQGKGAIV